MESVMRILIFVFLFAIAVGGTYWIAFRPSIDTIPALAEPELDLSSFEGTVRVDNDQRENPPSSFARTQAPLAKPAPDHYNTDPFADHTSLVAALEAAAALHGWTESETRNNQTRWLHLCREAEVYRRPNQKYDIQRLLEIDVRLAPLIGFAAFCADFVDAVQLQHEDHYLGLVEASLEGKERPHTAASELDEIRRLEDKDRAKELAMAHISQALARLDEYAVSTALGILTFDELLHPPIPDQGVDSYVLYLHVLQDAAAALICRELGNCRGQQHPMVLRQCMTSHGRNVGCYQPADIFDAIYQTQTPLEHMAFWSMFNQVSAMLTAHRRKGS